MRLLHWSHEPSGRKRQLPRLEKTHAPKGALAKSMETVLETLIRIALASMASDAPTPAPAPAPDPAPIVESLAALDPMRPPESIADCHEQLEAAGVSFDAARIPLHPAKSGDFMCGAPEVVRYKRGPAKIRWSSSSPKVSCAVALSMVRFEEIVQEEAMAHFGKRVYKIKHLGTYNCREMSAYDGWVSEHSYANAIDIAHFELTSSKTISVLDDWSDPGPKGKFLRRVSRRLYDEDVFSNVLSPDFDRLHRNHFHLDKAHYRNDGAAKSE